MSLLIWSPLTWLTEHWANGLQVLSGLLVLVVVGIVWYRRVHDRTLTAANGIDTVQLEELRFGEAPLVVDLRPPEVYRSRKGHIRGSLNVPFEQLERRIKELDTHDKRPVVLVDEGDDRLLLAAEVLKRHGLAWHYLLKGGMRAWRREGHPLEYFKDAPKR